MFKFEFSSIMPSTTAATFCSKNDDWIWFYNALRCSKTKFNFPVGNLRKLTRAHSIDLLSVIRNKSREVQEDAGAR